MKKDKIKKPPTKPALEPKAKKFVEAKSTAKKKSQTGPPKPNPALPPAQTVQPPKVF